MKDVFNIPLFRTSIIFFLITISLSYGIEITWAKEVIQVASVSNDQGGQSHGHTSNVSRNPTRSEGITDKLIASEVRCLALNIYFEARGESVMGQRAVGHVVMNRVAHSSYPSSICDVVRQGGEKKLHRCQFSWWCDGRSDRPANKKVWDQSLRLARQIYSGALQDITDGALWYHATYVTPYWSKILVQGDKIGQHIFYLEDRQAKNTL